MSGSDETEPRVVLVETSEALPGLLPFQAWDALGTADIVLLRDLDAHPSAPHLYAAGLDLAELEPAALERGDLDLTRPGAPDDRRFAKALVARAMTGDVPVYLLGPADGGLAPALAGMAAEHGLQIELVFLAPIPEGTELLRLVEVMRRLRDPEHGCPWDAEQDHHTLVTYLLEETYELVEAIEHGSDVDIVEELGDVLLQVVFHARIASDREAFGIDEVARGIADKLERRHPHVFADGDAETADDVRVNWEKLKAEEKGRTGPFEGVPEAMAGLMLLEALQRKAAKRDLVHEPAVLPELRQLTDDLAADGDHEEAIGALVDGLVHVAREVGVDPEVAARSAARRFRRQAEEVLRVATDRGIDLAEQSRDQRAALWDEVARSR